MTATDPHLPPPSSDAAGLAELARRHIDLVHSTALAQLRDPHLADDATQAVFLLLLRKASHLPPGTLIPGWLFKTTCHVVSEIRRQNARRQRRERESAMPASPNPLPANAIPAPADAAMAQEDRAALHQAIARLPGDDRNAIVLHYFQGHSTSQVAAALHTSDTAARIRLSRARERLRTLLRRVGITLSVAALSATLDASKAHAAPPATLASVQSLLDGAAPAAHLQSLVAGVLNMTLRAKLVTALAIVGILVLAFPLGYFLMRPRAQPPLPAAESVAPTPVAVVSRNTPKSAVLAAYHDALAGDQTTFLTHFATRSDDGKPLPPTASQQDVLRAVVRGMHAFELLTTAVGEKFGADVQAQLAQQIPTRVDPADVENAVVQQVDADHATVDMGKSGPGKVPVLRVNDTWLVDAAVLATLNEASVRKVDAQIEQINALTEAVKAGKFPDAQSFQQTIAQALKGMQ